MNTVGDEPWMTHPVMVASGAFWVCGGCCVPCAATSPVANTEATIALNTCRFILAASYNELKVERRLAPTDIPGLASKTSIHVPDRRRCFVAVRAYPVIPG
jgi:hypothetical protein